MIKTNHVQTFQMNLQGSTRALLLDSIITYWNHSSLLSYFLLKQNNTTKPINPYTSHLCVNSQKNVSRIISLFRTIFNSKTAFKCNLLHM